MATVILALSLTISKIFAVEITWPWPWTRMGQICQIERPHDFLRVGNSHICSKRLRLRDILSRNVHDLDLDLDLDLDDLYNIQRWNVKMTIGMPLANFYVRAVATMFVLSVIVCEIIMYKFSNVFASNLWPWKWRSMPLTIRIKIGRRTYLVNMHRNKYLHFTVQSFVRGYTIEYFVAHIQTYW